MFNLKLCNIMDKKIERVFELKTVESGTNCLIMYSRIDGEYGTILCTCSAELNGELIVARVADQAEPDGGFDFRLHELLYFIQFIVPLFKPVSHEVLSFTPSQSPQNP